MVICSWEIFLDVSNDLFKLPIDLSRRLTDFYLTFLDALFVIGLAAIICFGDQFYLGLYLMYLRF